jgi:hypothetical protein
MDPSRTSSLSAQEFAPQDSRTSGTAWYSPDFGRQAERALVW